MEMKQATEIAIQIRDEIEDLLNEKNITIPSSDREGVVGEARLYGEENTRLVEAMVNLLVQHDGGATRDLDTEIADHPLRQLAISVLDEFEELLEEKNISIRSSDREGRPEEARFYGAEYYALEDAIVEILMAKLCQLQPG